MWNVSEILRALVSAFALEHFTIITVFFLPGEDEVSVPSNA